MIATHDIKEVEPKFYKKRLMKSEKTGSLVHVIQAEKIPDAYEDRVFQGLQNSIFSLLI
jgi:hypothetical protein